MKAIISQIHAKSQRIKIKIPFEALQWRIELKKIQSIFYHKPQKQWSIPNTEGNLNRLKALFGEDFEIINNNKKVALPAFEMTPHIARQIEAMMTKMVLMGREQSTIMCYRSEILSYLKEFENKDLNVITKQEIEQYLFRLKDKHKISDSKQNQIINAIKFYQEKVLGLPRTIYDLTRPKKSKTLPGTLSEDEVFRLINQPTNIKHKAILSVLYSGGLRISEVTKLRIEDIKSAEKQIFIKAAKGKKDRYTLLSDETLRLLRTYFTECKPSYWLFEGMTGGQYSVSSIRKVFRKAAEAANICPWATPHTLRHSFGTHLLQANVNLRYIQQAMGHESPETTQIYTHIVSLNNDVVKSPLDRLLEKRKKETSRHEDETDENIG